MFHNGERATIGRELPFLASQVCAVQLSHETHRACVRPETRQGHPVWNSGSYDRVLLSVEFARPDGGLSRDCGRDPIASSLNVHCLDLSSRNTLPGSFETFARAHAVHLRGVLKSLTCR